MLIRRNLVMCHCYSVGLAISRNGVLSIVSYSYANAVQDVRCRCCRPWRLAANNKQIDKEAACSEPRLPPHFVEALHQLFEGGLESTPCVGMPSQSIWLGACRCLRVNFMTLFSFGTHL